MAARGQSKWEPGRYGAAEPQNAPNHVSYDISHRGKVAPREAERGRKLSTTPGHHKERGLDGKAAYKPQNDRKAANVRPSVLQRVPLA